MKKNITLGHSPDADDAFMFYGISKGVITSDKFSKLLCGKFRPNHFEGVVDVIDRFLKLIKPKYIFLGIKDFQQLWLIKNYIKYKHKTKVIPCKTIRYKDGMALSTRNYLLSNDDKEIGSNIYKIIKRNKNLINNKNYNQIIIKLKKKNNRNWS